MSFYGSGRPGKAQSGIDRRVKRAAGHLGRDTAEVERLLFDLYDRARAEGAGTSLPL